MYKVLIVEDESDIRMGMVNHCKWEQHRFSKVYVASNGKNALDQIAIDPPDFVITDIKMPIMDGMTLLREASKLYPEMLFALLTGYEEFEYAKQSLHYNVLDYLTKPCTIESLHNLLDQAALKLDTLYEKKQYLHKIEQDYSHLQSILQEQVLIDYIINPSYREIELYSYQNLNHLQTCKLRIVLFHIDEAYQQIDHYALMVLCREHFTNDSAPYVCSICNEQILVVLNYNPYPELFETLTKIKQTFYDYHGRLLTIAVGEETSISHIKDSYQNLLTYLHSKFYIGIGNIITTFDLPSIRKPISIGNFHTEYLTLALKSGNKEELDSILNHLFSQLNQKEFAVADIRAFTIQIYILLLQEAKKEQFEKYLAGIQEINQAQSISEIQTIIQQVAHEIIAALYENVHHCQNDIIRQILKLVEKYLEDERLSLKFIANEILYLNVDYLGKLFKSEMGEKFSRYVTDKRIEKAKDLFTQNQNISVSEVAHLCGFGFNAQYFSKVFKTNTGYTPKEYFNKFRQTNYTN